MHSKRKKTAQMIDLNNNTSYHKLSARESVGFVSRKELGSLSSIPRLSHFTKSKIKDFKQFSLNAEEE